MIQIDRRKVIYFEDLELNELNISGNYLLTEEEIIEFASKWDPQPFHLDIEEANASVFGGLSACSAHNFSIMSRLLFEREDRVKVLAGLGIESMRFVSPSSPGYRLSVHHSVVEKRESQSRPGTGIIKSHVQLVNQHGAVVIEMFTSALVAKKSNL